MAMSVRAYQQALKNAGFDPGPIDGRKGPRTIAAIKAFQRARGLAVDGSVGPITSAALNGGGSGGAAAAPAAPGMSAIDENILAQQFGFAAAVMHSDPELSALFKRAVGPPSYEQSRFTAELRNTKWYQSHGEQWRASESLRLADPSTYNQQLEQSRVRVSMLGAEVGATLGVAEASLAEQALRLGWDNNQLRRAMGAYVQYTDGRLIGQAGQWKDEWTKYADDMGLKLSDQWYLDRSRMAVNGTIAATDVESSIREMAISAFPHLGDRLRAGETLSNIADPYKQAMANILELNPEGLTMHDTTIRAAMASSDPKTGAPVLRTLFDFENDVRKDARWKSTKNAEDATMGVTNRVLKDFGLVS